MNLSQFLECPAFAHVSASGGSLVHRLTCVSVCLLQTADRSDAAKKAVFSRSGELSVFFQELRVPVLAAVRGLAAAAGCQLVASCDLVLASEKATFSGISTLTIC